MTSPPGDTAPADHQRAVLSHQHPRPAGGPTLPDEPVIHTPQELAQALGRWIADAPPEDTGAFIHRLIDQRRQHRPPPITAPIDHAPVIDAHQIPDRDD